MDDYLQRQDISKIVKFLLKDNKVLIIPTETLYGFSCSIFNIKGGELIKKIKQKPLSSELTVLVPSFSVMKKLIRVTPQIKKVVREAQKKRIPLTVIGFKNPLSQYQIYASRNDYVGVRIISEAWLKKLLTKTGPLFSTSVNRYGSEPITDFSELSLFLPANQIVKNQKIKMTNKPSKIYNTLYNTFER